MDLGFVQSGVAVGDEMRRPVVCSGVVCPRPRRIGLALPPRSAAPNFRSEFFESKSTNELLELILNRGNRHTVESPSPPPFYCGSPPSRASNPLIHDARFGLDLPSPPVAPPATPTSPSAARKGCGPLKFGPKPAAVRIEGFDCDRRSRGIAAVA